MVSIEKQNPRDEQLRVVVGSHHEREGDGSKMLKDKTMNAYTNVCEREREFESTDGSIPVLRQESTHRLENQTQGKRWFNWTGIRPGKGGTNK